MQRTKRAFFVTLALTVLLSLGAALPVLAAPNAQVGIEDVGADTPAEAAGLQAGDVILAVNGSYVTGVEQIAAAILAAEPGDELTLNVLRGGEFLEVTATLGERDGRTFLGIVPAQPDDAAPAPQPTEEATEEPAEEAAPEATPVPTEEPVEEAAPEATPAPTEEPAEEAAPVAEGALIGEVVPDSPAARAGIQPGDLITAVEGMPVNADNDLATLIGQYAPGDDVGITFRDPTTGDEMTIVVTLGENPGDATRPFLGVRYMIPGMDMEILPLTPEATPEADEEEAAPEATPEAQEEDAAPDATPEAAEEAPEATPEADEEDAAPEATPAPAEEAEATPEAEEEALPVPTDVTGALIGAVLTDGPADVAGILPGDVIVAVEDDAVNADNDLAALISQYAPGAEVGVTIIDPESGEEVTIVVVLGENPNDATVPFLGVRYVMIQAEEAAGDADSDVEAESDPAADAAPDAETEAESDSGRRTPVRPPRSTPSDAPQTEAPAAEATPEATPEPAEEAAPESNGDGNATPEPMPEAEQGFSLFSGAVVGRVVEDSPAAAAGIRTGDVMVAIDGTAIDADNDLASLIGTYAPGDEVEITLVDWRSGDEFSVMVTLGENPDVAGAPFLGVSYMPLDMENMMPRHGRGQNGGDATPPFFRHHGMDMDDFMDRLGCNAENEDERPPFCHMFDDLPQDKGQ